MGGIFLKLLIAGGDARYACLAEQAHAAGWDLLALGLERAAHGRYPACTLDQVDQADAVLLNNPWRRGLMLPLTDHPFELSNLFARMRKDALLLLALGPTATVLAHDLAMEGVQALDIGHIDIEYEWYRTGATSKTVVAGKVTQEAHAAGEDVLAQDGAYLAQIIARVGC